MPFIITSPSSAGSAWDYDITWEAPWPGWSGTQTWAQMFDDIRAATGYGTDIVERVRSRYYIRKRLRFVGIDVLLPLLDSTIICEETGLLGFHDECDIQFGEVYDVAGRETGVNGCTIIEDQGSGSRQNDNFNKNTRIVMDSTLRLYDTTFRRINTTRSDFDWSTDSLIVMRDVVLQMRGNQFNHFYGRLDIDGLEVQTDSGSSIEFRTPEEDFIKFDNVFPFRLDGNLDQRVLVMFVPVGATNFANTYTFVGFAGVNHARWSLGDGRSATFINPYFTNLQSVGGNSGRSGHAWEKRTVLMTFLDGESAPLEDVRVQIQHRIDGVTIPEGWLMNNQFPYDVNELTDENGVVDTLVNRFYWRHNSPNGGTQIHERHELTPHIFRAYKYSYLPIEQPLDVTPTGRGSGGFSFTISMLADEHVTLDKAAALALQSSVEIQFHPTPVTWEGLEWDCTITTDLTAAQLYQWIRAVQDEGTALGGDFLPNLMPTPTESVRGMHDRINKAFRFITTAGDPAIGFARMQSKNGTYYIPPVQYVLTVEGFESGSDVVIYDPDVPSTGDGSNVKQTFDEVDGTSVSYGYTYTPGKTIHVGLFKPGMVPLVISGVTLAAQNSTLPVTQTIDRNYF